MLSIAFNPTTRQDVELAVCASFIDKPTYRDLQPDRIVGCELLRERDAHGRFAPAVTTEIPIVTIAPAPLPRLANPTAARFDKYFETAGNVAKLKSLFYLLKAGGFRPQVVGGRLVY
jgi:hypothetical protein